MNWQDYFYYDESSPSCLRWKINIYAGDQCQILKAAAGDVAGSLSKRDGYWRVFLHSKSYLVHRVVAALHWGEVPRIVDHKNGLRANNKLENLRPASATANARNAKKKAHNSSGKTGVKITTTHNGRYSNWVAYAESMKGGQERLVESFSWNKYGEREAFRLACEARDKMIEELNKQGAGYTGRHGMERI